MIHRKKSQKKIFYGGGRNKGLKKKLIFFKLFLPPIATDQQRPYTDIF